MVIGDKRRIHRYYLMNTRRRSLKGVQTKILYALLGNWDKYCDEYTGKAYHREWDFLNVFYDTNIWR